MKNENETYHDQSCRSSNGRIEHDITHTYTQDTQTTATTTCGRRTTAALHPNNPTINTRSRPRPFLFSSTSRSPDRTATMQARDQASMGMSCHRARSPVNQCNHTVEIFNQLGAGSLPLEQGALRESHHYWKVRVLRPPTTVLCPQPAS